MTSAGSGAIISKLSLMRRHIQRKSKDSRRHGMRQSLLKNFWMQRKKLLTKQTAGDKIIKLSLETATKKNKKMLTKTNAFDKI